MSYDDTYIVEFYTATEMNKLQLLATTWMAFTKIMLRKGDRYIKAHALGFHLYKVQIEAKQSMILKVWVG